MAQCLFCFCFLLSDLARGGMQRLIVCVCFIGRLVVIVAPRKYGSIESAFEPEVPMPHNAYIYKCIHMKNETGTNQHLLLECSFVRTHPLLFFNVSDEACRRLRQLQVTWLLWCHFARISSRATRRFEGLMAAWHRSKGLGLLLMAFQCWALPAHWQHAAG